MTKTLFVIAHPNIKQSIGSKTIIEAFKKLNMDTEYDNIYELYPDYNINVKAEQEKLLKADAIVLQFPFYWYNSPSLLRKWFEDVLEHGFAYGSNGVALKGKKLIVSFTTGAALNSYSESIPGSCTLDDLVKGFQQLANLCGLEWCGFVATGSITYGVSAGSVASDLEKHAKQLADKINA
ncbi:flavo protein [Piromyces finnis]|uniref:Flavo protein n=1 Tax=Piromyces finnis TaxID=1754191 RepID=A0A1Y1UYS7_9FUNG|nr:flavo protein [Piromyces finnis]|eukprot:ORX42966.1 flavo protein [Piromyces finnis]